MIGPAAADPPAPRAAAGLTQLGMGLAHGLGLTALSRAALRPLGCLLTFHRVARPQDWAALPNRDFYVDLGFLGRLLDHLTATGWDVVTLDEALLRLRGPRPARRFVNISIDDTYRDTAELAQPCFAARGLPVTLFVTTGIPDGTLPLWQAGLESILLAQDSVTLPGGARVTARTAGEKRVLFARLAAAWEAGDSPAPYAAFCHAHGYEPAELRERHAMSWATLRALSQDPLVEIGGHSVSHPHLARLDAAAAEAEIAGCRARLRQLLGLEARHFAFPFGRAADCGPREFAIAARAGYASAATTRKGVLRPADTLRPHSLPRNTVNGAHQDLRLMQTHLSGLSGLVTQMLGAG